MPEPRPRPVPAAAVSSSPRDARRVTSVRAHLRPHESIAPTVSEAGAAVSGQTSSG